MNDNRPLEIHIEVDEDDVVDDPEIHTHVKVDYLLLWILVLLVALSCSGILMAQSGMMK